MSVTSTLHLNFRGQAREALEFYHSVFGGDIVLAPYGEVPAGQDPEQADQIAWGQVLAPSGFHVMAYDVQNAFPHDPGRNAFYFSLRSTEAEEINQAWTGLSEGTTVVEPIGPAVFSPLYGKLVDRFGVTWILDVIVPWNG